MKKSNVIIRVDDRLVHGQVITGWVKLLDLNNIIVANDEILHDKTRMQIMKLPVPVNVSIEFLSIQTAIKYFKKNKWSKLKTIVLFESPKDAYFFVKEADNTETMNIGGLHFKDNRIQITHNLSVNHEDKEYLFKISELNVKLEGRALPSEDPYDVIKVLKKDEFINI